jgi:TRAP-type C4-dicarboxylate transport system permease small subunit
MGDRGQRVLSMATDIALIALMAVLLSTWGPVWEASSVLKSPSLGIPRSVLALAGLISYALTAVYCLESLARTVLRMEPPLKVLKDEDGALVA